MSSLSERIRTLLEDPSEHLDELRELLEDRGGRALPRPWSQLPLLAEDHPEIEAIWPELARALGPSVHSEDSDLRLRSIQLLGLLPCAEAREALLEALGDPLSVCRVAAIDGLAVTPSSPEVVDRLVELLAGDHRPTRLHVTAALGQLGDQRAVASLRSILLDTGEESSNLRQWAAFSLADLGGSDAVDALVEANLDGTQSLSLDLEVRAASRNLGKPVFSALEEAMKSENPERADRAGEALARLYDQEDDQAIQKEAVEEVAKGISEILGALRDRGGETTMEDFLQGLDTMVEQFEGEAQDLLTGDFDDTI